MKSLVALFGLCLFILVTTFPLFAETGKVVYGVVWRGAYPENDVKVYPNCSTNYYVTTYAAIPSECGGPYTGNGVYWVDEDHEFIYLCSYQNHVAARKIIDGKWYRGLATGVYMADFPWQYPCYCQRQDIWIVEDGPSPECEK